MDNMDAVRNPLEFDPNDIPSDICWLVKRHVQENLEKTDPDVDFRVFVVWFAFTLGNYKALVSTSLPDGRYYEVTHNHVKGETYIDTYVKIRNVCIET